MHDQVVPQQSAEKARRGWRSLQAAGAQHLRVERILSALEIATAPRQMAIPGWRFHSLKGKPQRYAVDASGNFRVTFGFKGQDAIDVDLEDYH
jgi:toxin HigB-1